jgi:hypothetical protein
LSIVTQQGVEEAIAKAEEMSELRLALPEVQKPFPRTRFTRTKNILHDLDDISFLLPSAFSPVRPSHHQISQSD